MDEVKRIAVNLIIKEFLITFDYETRKGHRKEQQRYIKHLNKEDAKGSFTAWAKEVRTMSNVKILGITELEARAQEIAL